MLKLNCERMFAARGIVKPSNYLRKKGFRYHQIYRILKGKQQSIPYVYLENLCLAFNCTPNDLLDWIPQDPQYDNDMVAINKLQPTKKQTVPVNSVPYDKLVELAETMKQNKGKK